MQYNNESSHDNFFFSHSYIDPKHFTYKYALPIAERFCG